ncbi:unnamed protein product [Moneuplotes crassus]|uniref:Uncharacterized protein n=1 Tax=Euplotes crassus TaxID=5936 RepID=A0AAD1XNW3_EUPCR|nr:unnamed protein product [Moneuplotes crassus]
MSMSFCKRLFSNMTKDIKFPSVSHRKVKRFYKDVSIVKSEKTKIKPEKEYTQSKSHVNWRVSHSDQYYEIYLDRFSGKSLYKDEMLIPSYPLAIALAEEWAYQPAKPHYLNPRSMKLNTLMAQAIRTENDENLQKYLKKTITEILGCDQVCFQEDPRQLNPVKNQLAHDQRERGEPLLKFMKDKYGMSLNVFTDFGFMGQDPSYLKIKDVLEETDPYVLLSIFNIASSTKSTMVALALLNEEISLEDAIIVSRLEELYQQKFYGVVEGAHDYDEARTISDVAAAKNFITLLSNE